MTREEFFVSYAYETSQRLLSVANGHTWKMHTMHFSDGGMEEYVDFVAWSEGNHNGPECITCGYTFCSHCRDAPDSPCHSPGVCRCCGRPID